MVQPVTEKEPTMTITITHPQTASRRARYVVIAALIAVAATLIGYLGVQTMTDDPAMTSAAPGGVGEVIAPRRPAWAPPIGGSWGVKKPPHPPARTTTPPADLDVSAQ